MQPPPPRLNSRSWKNWAKSHIIPELDLPEHWASSGVSWQPVSYGAIGMPATWFVQGVGRWPARGGGFFQAHMLVIPLYRPTDAPYFNWTMRLTSATGASGFDNPTDGTKVKTAADLTHAVNATGLSFLEDTGNLEGFQVLMLEYEQQSRASGRRFGYGEELGYTQLLLGDLAGAEEQLALASEPDPNERDWEAEKRQRCAHILHLLRTDPGLARTELDAWADASARALQVARVAEPPSTV